MKMDSQEFYLKSPREMWDRFGDYPQALKNTMAIAERCNLQLEFGRVQLPEMPVPEGHDVDSYLAEVCHRRLAERYPDVTPAMRERLDYELAVVNKTGFAAYFLLLDDIIGFARREGIMVGPGRGSAVGSLASYCLGIPYGDVDRVAKLIPPKSDLKGALAVPELREMYEHTAYVKRLIDTALQLEDIKRHNSTHAAGVVISREPLVNVTPLVRVGKEAEESQATQYEFAVLDKIGLLKMAILGQTTLTLIQRTINNVEKVRGHVIEPDEIPLDDPCIYELLSTGETAGVFQLESGGMRKALRDMKPDRFTDIVAAVALYRPGPMSYIDQYNRRKNGLEPITYLHPDLEPILSDTYAVLVYQEQVLQIAIKLAGYGWGQADILRKAMGKKLPEEMKKQQAAFEEGVKKRGYPVKLAKDLWPLIEVFAGYGFNKCAYAKTYIKLDDGSRMHISA